MQILNTKGRAQMVGCTKVRAEECFDRCESRQGEYLRVKGRDGSERGQRAVGDPVTTLVTNTDKLVSKRKKKYY